MKHKQQRQNSSFVMLLGVFGTLAAFSVGAWAQTPGPLTVEGRGASQMDVGSLSNGACFGVPPYPCALTDLSNPAFIVPDVGGLLGANTIAMDSLTGNPVVRITDYHTLGTSPPQPNYQIDAGGSAEVNFMSSDDAYFYVTDSGSSMEPFSWNGATMQAAPRYGTYPAKGSRMSFGAGGEFSYTIPGRLYWMADGTTAPCGIPNSPCIAYYDLTQSNVANAGPFVVKDLGADPTCYPGGWSSPDGRVTWGEPVTASRDDQTFTTAYSTAGGQGTGELIVVWNRTTGCRWWDTHTQTVGGGWGPTGAIVSNGGAATNTFYVHNDRLSQDGNYIKMSTTGCTGSNCWVNFFWNIPTLNVYSSAATQSGHSVIGNEHVVNATGDIAGVYHQQAMNYALMSTPGVQVPLWTTGPPTGPWDAHFSWQNANLSDSNVLFSSSFVTNVEVPTQAWNNEIDGFDAGGSDIVYRFGRNYITANSSASFAAGQGIGSVSADGNWFAFASDWNCQLGSNTGSATGTTSPYNCRADVFMLSLTGAGAAPVASMSPTSLSFGNEYVGSTSQPETVTLSNTGNAALSISSVTIGADYTQTNNCGGTLAAGASCSFSVSFAPTTVGQLSEFLQIADNAVGSPQSVALTGSGALRPVVQVTISPASLVFGNQVVGTTSTSLAATLTATGNAPLTITSIAPSGDFSLATTATSCPYAGGIVNAGATCTIDVSFRPTATGPLTGSVVVTDNASDSPQAVSLTGTGTGNAVPQIDLPVMPGSAVPGTPGLTLTVNGTGFAAGASVEWNGSALATNRVSGEQLTAVVPAAELAAAGTASVTVVNPAPGGGASNGVFFPITNPTSSVWFGRTDVATGNGPQWVGTGDFNQDGKPDLAVANKIDGTISILLGNGDGVFSVHPAIGVGSGPVSGTIGDVNGDGIPDLAVAGYANNTVSMLVGIGGGAFDTPTSVATGNGPIAVAIADFNGDGALDLAVANNIDNTISIMLGNVNGTFSNSLGPVSVGNGPVSLVSADLNGDGIPDLAVANSVDGTVSILFGRGDGTFTSQPVISLAPGLSSLVTADFNGDGLPDLAAANSTTNSISILLGAGNGVFNSAAPLSTGNGPSGLTVGDWNGDGVPDVLVANTTDSTVTVLLGNGAGTFQTGLTFGTGSAPVSVAAADFNGDGRLDVAAADSGSGSASVLLQAPQVSVSPGSVAFGNQQVGTSSSPQTTTLTNTGTAALAISSISVSGTNSGDFSQTNTCGATVAAGANCTITLTFTPAASGARTATVNVTDNASGSPQTISLNGAGTLPGGSLTPGSLSFGNRQIGTSSAAQNVTLTNTGGAPLTITSIGMSGSNPGDFGQTNACPISPSTLAAGSSCVISVTFAPTASGTRNASLSVTDNASGSPQSVTLTGTGTQPAASLAPSSVTFGNQAVGTKSSGQAVTLTNTGTATLILNSISITGANAGDFSQTNTCGRSVAAGSNCIITVIFAPTGTGIRSASLSVADNAPTSPQRASLSGAGAGPAVTFSPTSLTFGVRRLGTRSATQRITLSNTGNAALTITNIAITGGNAEDFSQTNTCPLSPSMLAAGKNCSLSVTFEPTAPGIRTASLSVTDNALGNPQTVSLTGTGMSAYNLRPLELWER
jgi:hypothetical protein